MRRAEFGFNFFGYITGSFGLAVAGRSTLALLLEQGYPVCVRDVDTFDGRSGRDTTYAELLVRKPWGLPYGVDLFHLNPPEYQLRLPLVWPLLPLGRRMNVMVPFWELPSLPPQWTEVLRSMDAILAPTRFVESIVREAIPDARVMHYPQPIELPPNVEPDRARFGIPHDRTVFLSAFDVANDMQRKNPWAAIAAFDQAFSADDAVSLVIKVNSSRISEHGASLLRQLHDAVERNPNIRVIDAQLSYADVLSLYASCDAFVSLHRAEGLGLIIMETMSLGLPAIVTGWSGNMDFTDQGNSCLVGYDLVPVEASRTSYREESARSHTRWAEPRVEEAAEWMRLLAEEPELRMRLGRKAAEDMRSRKHIDRSIVFEWMREIYESDSFAEEHAPKVRQLRRVRRAGFVSLFDRVPSAVGRRIARRLPGRAHRG